MTVCGWVDRYRNLGGLLFLDIRDHTGTGCGCGGAGAWHVGGFHPRQTLRVRRRSLPPRPAPAAHSRPPARPPATPAGIIQVIVDPQRQPEVAAKAERLRSEYVVAVSGQVRLRSDPNPRLKTGTLEITPSEVKVGGLGGGG